MPQPSVKASPQAHTHRTHRYGYYAIAAAGISYPAKPLITAMQITQFITGFYAVWGYIHVPCFVRDQGMVISWLFNYIYVGGVLLLFLQFFWTDNFGAKKLARSRGKPKAM